MKLLLTTIVCWLAVGVAKADSFTIIRDGNEYLCQQTGPTNPIDSVDCANKAYAGPFSKDQAQQLCAGARSTAPADCAIKAYAGPFSQAQAVTLCIHAQTTGPADCAAKAYAGPFSQDESVTLCSDNGTVANADCAAKAYAGPYSKDEAIKMCKASPLLVMRSLNLLEQSQDLKPKIESIKNNLK
ncbi:MAG: hypothetical protein ACXWQQ_04535 [Pseudobdellovibrio sp.]